MPDVPAIILTENGAGESVRKISRLLDFFGVSSRMATAEELLAELAGSGGPVRVLGTAKEFQGLAAKLESQPDKKELWKARAHSAFGFGGNEAELTESIDGLFGGKVKLLPAEKTRPWTVSGKCRDFTGPFAGLEVANQSVAMPVGQAQGADVELIISNPNGAALLRLEWFGCPFFLSTSGVIDIDSPLPGRDFDIRPLFILAVPAVLYIKWAFAEICWQPPETTACLVIDDPLLWPRYGHLNFEHLLGLMERINFSSSVAFIPWNWNRNSRQTVRLFQDHPSRFSLSIHGCDHTAGEYGGGNRERLAWKSQRAVQRMERHRGKTGLACDRVMVFPQGVFSEAAMAALKYGDYIGTVNSEVISADPSPRPVTIAEYWDVAVMNYSEFPIYTRRYPWAGIENFAFDILLGKPCLTVIHHNDCHDGYQRLTEGIEQMNKLNVKLRWTNLAEVVHRGFRQRQVSPGVMEIEMYGSEIWVENPADAKRTYRIKRRESAPEAIKQINIAGAPVKWSSVGKYVSFEMELNPGEVKGVAVTFKELPLNDLRSEGIYYETKVMLRRYLCEVRDHVLMPKKFST